MSPEENESKRRWKPPAKGPTDVHEPSPVRSPDKPVPEEPPEPQEASEDEGDAGEDVPLGAAGRSDTALEP